MCQFFSFVGDGFGNYKYFDWEYRKDHLADNCDSHTAILTFNKVPPNMQDRWSKYEYDPLTRKFTIDELVEGHDHDSAESWVNSIDFKTIIQPLVIKSIHDPLLRIIKPTKKDIEMLKEWASVGDSVGDSVGAYYSSFFDIGYKYNYDPCVKLWERGLVPSFDGTIWRLHSGKNAKIVYEWKK